MADRNVKATIQVRRDTADNWESTNPILAEGEFGYDTTNKITKIGDGVTPWNELAEFTAKTGGTFATMSWDEISRISVSGEARKYFNIGDTKTIELSTGEEIEVRIIGFNHDERSDGSGTAGITCEMVNMLSTTYTMNSSSTNAGGWDESVMRTSNMETFLSQLPSDLQSVILKVNKKASAGSQSTDIVTSQDKLFLFAAAEIWSETAIKNSTWSHMKTYSETYIQEGKQYEYYANEIGDQEPNSVCTALVKYRNGSSNGWWLRDPYLDGSTYFLCVYYLGIVYDNGASTAYGVSFGFCV